MRYLDPDGRFIINNIFENEKTVKEYAINNRIRVIGIQYLVNNQPVLLRPSNFSIPKQLENGFNIVKLLSFDNKKKADYKIFISATKMDNGNYEISMTIEVKNKATATVKEYTGIVAYSGCEEVESINKIDARKLEQMGELILNKINGTNIKYGVIYEK